MSKKHPVYIEYNIKITCEVTSNGIVIPCGSEQHITKNNKLENVLDYPPFHEIELIWLGKYFQYPRIKTK